MSYKHRTELVLVSTLCVANRFALNNQIIFMMILDDILDDIQNIPNSYLAILPDQLSRMPEYYLAAGSFCISLVKRFFTQMIISIAFRKNVLLAILQAILPVSLKCVVLTLI